MRYKIQLWLKKIHKSTAIVTWHLRHYNQGMWIVPSLSTKIGKWQSRKMFCNECYDPLSEKMKLFQKKFITYAYNLHMTSTRTIHMHTQYVYLCIYLYMHRYMYIHILSCLIEYKLTAGRDCFIFVFTFPVLSIVPGTQYTLKCLLMNWLID